MTLELRKLLGPLSASPVRTAARAGRGPCRARDARLADAAPRSLWDKFIAKDDTFKEEPADKLYNEGLYLMNQSKDPKAASKKFEEVDRQHPYSDWARKSLLMSAYAVLQCRRL